MRQMRSEGRQEGPPINLSADQSAKCVDVLREANLGKMRVSKFSKFRISPQFLRANGQAQPIGIIRQHSLARRPPAGAFARTSKLVVGANEYIPTSQRALLYPRADAASCAIRPAAPAAARQTHPPRSTRPSRAPYPGASKTAPGSARAEGRCRYATCPAKGRRPYQRAQ